MSVVQNYIHSFIQTLTMPNSGPDQSLFFFFSEPLKKKVPCGSYYDGHFFEAVFSWHQ